MNVKLYSYVKLYNEGNAYFNFEINTHSNFEINTHEKDEELLDRDVHNDSNAERPNIETRTEPRLSKYVTRHHPAEQIIGDKEARPMTRNRLRSETYLLSKIKPMIVNDALPK